MFHVERLFASAGLSASPGFFDRAREHLELVYRWNRVHDLTAIAQDQAAERHVLDSVLPFVGLEAPRTLLDIGTGAGFPGIPLALWWTACAVTLCEPLRKRRSFLETACAQLRLTARVEGQPAERLGGQWEMVTSRATLPWRELVVTSERLLLPGGALVALLGPEQAPTAEEAHALGGQLRTYQLPSGAGRAVLMVPKRST